MGIRAGGENEIERPDGRDRCEVLHRIEWKRLVDGRAYRGAVGDEADRIAVGRLREHRARRRNAPWSRLILHHEPLAELVAKLLRCHAGGDVGHACRGKRQDETNRTARIILLGVRPYRQRSRGSRRGKHHRKLSSGDPVLGHLRLSCSCAPKIAIQSCRCGEARQRFACNMTPAFACRRNVTPSPRSHWRAHHPRSAAKYDPRTVRIRPYV